jgi:hypothetical protein
MIVEKGIGSFFMDEATAKKVKKFSKAIGVNVVTEGSKGDCVYVRIENIGMSPILFREKHELVKSLVKEYREQVQEKKNWCGVVAGGIIVAYFLLYTCVVLLW